jgi:hypothetical protein
MLANLAPFFYFSIFFFGDDGTLETSQNWPLKTQKKRKEKEKNHCYYYYLTGVYTRNVVYTEVL